MDKEKLTNDLKRVLADPVIYDGTGEVVGERFWETFFRETEFVDGDDYIEIQNEVLTARVQYLEDRINDKNFEIDENRAVIFGLNEEIKSLKEDIKNG